MGMGRYGFRVQLDSVLGLDCGLETFFDNDSNSNGYNYLQAFVAVTNLRLTKKNLAPPSPETTATPGIWARIGGAGVPPSTACP